MQRQIFEVSQINIYIKDKFDTDPFLGEICVRGELSNYKIYPSGHHYFTLKDPEGSLRSVMFKGSAMRLRFRPESGMKVIVFGRITVFPRDGAYQMYCETMTPDGVGDLHVAFEQMKSKLLDEGLFDQSHKKSLPLYPHRIAIITSSAGAAIHDMMRVLGQRYPLAQVLLLPVRVQGEDAPLEIVGAIRYANQWNLGDVIITGRGGGSIEDLWAFNDERVARAIFASKIPVISAVGHEPDVTISDFVADMRAATPSNAAELVCPDFQELKARLRHFEGAMEARIDTKLKQSRQKLTDISARRVLQSPMNYVHDRRLVLDHGYKSLWSAFRQQLEGKRQRFVRLAAGLDAMSPLKVLGRGYTLIKTQEGVLKSIYDTKIGETIGVQLADGTLNASITEILEAPK